MQEYQKNGVRVGWLIVPATRTVYIYAQGADTLCLTNTGHLANDAILPGLSLDLDKIWEPGI